MSNPAACASQPGLWDAATAKKLAYKPGAVLNAAFAGAPADRALAPALCKAFTQIEPNKETGWTSIVAPSINGAWR